MKFNWGFGLFVTIVIGTSGILLLVYLSSRERIDLVTDDYYPKELVYEAQLNKMRNSNTLPARVKVYSTQDSVFIEFPAIAPADSIKGELWFYFPADKRHDRKVPIVLDQNYKQSFDPESFREGKYVVLMDWRAGQTEYFQKDLLFLNE